MLFFKRKKVIFRDYLNKSRAYLRVITNMTSLTQIVISGVVSGFAILILYAISIASGYPSIIGSFGASIFLLFAVPKSEFSKTKNLIVGHFLASFIGVIFLMTFGANFWLLPIALCFTVVGMQILRVSHPPAASNPIIIFFSEPSWSFIFIPTLFGAAIIGLIAFFYRKSTSKGNPSSYDF
tara:strand:+ start:700 stop:1242 length:543 start_codon:yes stop_codon:yes gene_type:complete